MKISFAKWRPFFQGGDEYYHSCCHRPHPWCYCQSYHLSLLQIKILPPITYEADTTHQLGLLYEVHRPDGVPQWRVQNVERFQNCSQNCADYEVDALMLVDARQLGNNGDLKVLCEKFCDQLDWTLILRAAPGEQIPSCYTITQVVHNT